MKERPKRPLVRVQPAGAHGWRTVDQHGKVIAQKYVSRAQAEHHARELMGGKR
mgnify:CR=1 FL=1